MITTIIIFIPLLGAILMSLLPNDDERLLRYGALGVAAVPPSAFYADNHRAAKLARFCFAKRSETLHEAATRLAGLPAKAGALHI